jgi:hypothetical protein
MPSTSEMMPVTLEAAEKAPTSSGRPAWRSSSASSPARSTWPFRSSPTATTSAADSRQGSRFEWCSNGPTNTTGRAPAGLAGPAGRPSSSSPTSLATAAVAPDPANMTRSWSVPPTAWWITWRACSRSRVVWRPVPELSVWVLAYQGRTRSRMASSTKSSARPEAVQSA